MLVWRFERPAAGCAPPVATWQLYAHGVLVGQAWHSGRWWFARVTWINVDIRVYAHAHAHACRTAREARWWAYNEVRMVLADDAARRIERQAVGR